MCRRRRFKLSRRKRLLRQWFRFVGAMDKLLDCFCCRGDDSMSVWKALEKEPMLLKTLADSINQWEELQENLEQSGLLSGDCVDLSLETTAEGKLHNLLSKLVRKDAGTFRKFKRTLIEIGEFSAVELLSENFSVSEASCSTHPDLNIASMSLSESNTELAVGESQSLVEELAGPQDIGEYETDVRISLSSLLQVAAITDGGGEVPVQSCSKVMSGSQMYEMTSRPRGICVIFNVMVFKNFPLKRRYGSEQDCFRMTRLFQAFGFMVFVHDNPTSDEIISLLDTYANSDVNEAHDAFVCIFMSHGNLNHIHGSDYSPIKLSTAFQMFNNVNCPTLKEKPKLFLVQTCRGDGIDNGTDARKDPIAEEFYEDGIESDAGPCQSSGASLSSEDSANSTNRRISSWSDMYIAYAVVEGYESLRDMSTGSWFLKAVYEVLATYAHEEDLDTMMLRVNQRVLGRSRADGQRQCPEVRKIGWRKKLYFNPGS